MLLINGKEHNSLSVAADTDLYAGIMRQAKLLGNTKSFAKEGGMGDVGAALFLLAAVDFGVPPMLAAQGRLHWVEQKASPSAATMLGMAYEVGVRVKFTEQNDVKVAGVFTRDGSPDYLVEFTFEEAKKAGLTGKDNWQKYKQDMLTARFLTRGLRLIAADVLAGVYSSEELGDGDVADKPDPRGVAVLADASADFAQMQAAPKATAPAPAPRPPATPPPVMEPDDEDEDDLTPPPIKAPVPAKAPANRKVNITANVAAIIKEAAPLTDKEGRTGGTLDPTATAKSIYASMLTVFPEAMTKGMLSEKLKSYGAKSSLDLTPLQLMAMIQWADQQVSKQKEIDADAQPEADSADEIPAFNPVRGAATKGKTGKVEDAVPENFDDQATSLISEYGYDSETSPEQTKRMTRDALQDALTAQAAD